MEYDNTPRLYYQRAQCYVYTGKIAEAVADLRPLVAAGDTTAIRLYDLVNPIKKRKVGTVVRCKDGTLSHPKHRVDTCSYHGGVKDWAEPVYEEYREY